MCFAFLLAASASTPSCGKRSRKLRQRSRSRGPRGFCCVSLGNWITRTRGAKWIELTTDTTTRRPLFLIGDDIPETTPPDSGSGAWSSNFQVELDAFSHLVLQGARRIIVRLICVLDPSFDGSKLDHDVGRRDLFSFSSD